MEYTELLSRPEWGRKCNEILQRDQFVCRKCGAHGFHNNNFMYFDTIEELDNYLGKDFFASNTILNIFDIELSSLMEDNFTDVELHHVMDIDSSSLYGFLLLKNKANNKIFTNVLNTPKGLRIVIPTPNSKTINCKAYCLPEYKVIQNENIVNYGTIIQFEEQITEKPILFVSKNTDFSIVLENGDYDNLKSAA